MPCCQAKRRTARIAATKGGPLHHAGGWDWLDASVANAARYPRCPRADERMPKVLLSVSSLAACRRRRLPLFELAHASRCDEHLQRADHRKGGHPDAEAHLAGEPYGAATPCA